MKRIGLLTLLAVTCATALSFTGCVTRPKDGGNANAYINPSNTAVIVEGTVEIATLYAMKQDTNTIQYFLAAASALDLILDNGVVDPQQVRETLAQATAGDSSAETWLVIAAGLNVYRVFAANVVSEKLDQVEYLRPVLIGFRNGIKKGLLGPGVLAK